MMHKTMFEGIVLLVVYVDDILLTHSAEAVFQQSKFYLWHGMPLHGMGFVDVTLFSVGFSLHTSRTI